VAHEFVRGIVDGIPHNKLDEMDNFKMTPFMLGKMFRNEKNGTSDIEWVLPQHNIKRNLSINLTFLSQRNVKTKLTSEQSKNIER